MSSYLPLRPSRWLPVFVTSLACLAGCSDASGAGGGARDVDADASVDAGVALHADGGGAQGSAVVVLPDTQFYACAYPEIFEAQTQWVLDHRVDRQIAIVLHTGDVVDSDVQAQWEVAAGSLHKLDGVVPYLISTGNHDLSSTRASLFGSYFQAADLATSDWQPSSRDPQRLDNSYALVTLSGQRWLVLGLEFAPRDAVLQWASDVLSAHADLPTILFTHAYLYSDGKRYDRAIVPRQPYHPDRYQCTPAEGINDGEDLWQKLIEPHENVRLVLSGHVIPDGTAHSVAVRKSGSKVHQLLANYQLCDACPCAQVMGGDGYLRVLQLDAAGKSFHVSTYSPYLDAALRDADNELTLPLD